MPGPLVSVVIPAYDREATIVRAVASALRQTHGDVEVLVVDDASTDGTVETARAVDDDRLRVLESGTNRGPAHARNVGIEQAGGEFVAFLDSDDEWLPHKLESQLAVAHRTASGVVYCPYLQAVDGYVLAHRVALHRGDVFESLARGWAPAITSSVLVRRDVLVGDHRFDPELDGVEDYDYWLQLAARTTFEVVDEAYAIVDKTPGTGRVTMDLHPRLAAIARLRAKWMPEMRARGLEAEFTRTCDQLELVAHLTVGSTRPRGRRLALHALSQSEIPPRTRAAGLVRALAGPRATARLHRMWFRARGVPRAQAQGRTR